MEPKKVSKIGYVIGVALMVLSILAMSFSVYSVFKNIESPNNQKFQSSDKAFVIIKEPGSYDIYHEYTAPSHLGFYPSFTFVDSANNAVHSSPADYSGHYSIGNVQGDLVANVTFDEPGSYWAYTNYDDNSYTLNFNLQPRGGLFKTIGLFVFLLLASVFLSIFGIAVIIITAIRRNKQNQPTQIPYPPNYPPHF